MADRYLNNNGGSDGNDGSTPTLAWASLPYALGQVADGDTLYIEASATTYKPLTYYTLPDNLTIIGSTNIQNPLVQHVIFDCQSSASRGLRLTENCNMTDIIVKDYANNITDGFFNVHYTNSAICTWNLTRVELRNMRTASGTATRGGIFESGFNGGDYTRLNVNFQNCIFNGLHASNAGASIMRLSGAVYVTTDNCTYYKDNTGTPIEYFATTGNGVSDIASIIHKNLAIKNEHSTTFDIGKGAAESDDGTIYDGNVTLTGASTNALNADPLFADVNNNLFHPKPNSPLINGGQPL